MPTRWPQPRQAKKDSDIARCWVFANETAKKPQSNLGLLSFRCSATQDLPKGK